MRSRVVMLLAVAVAIAGCSKKSADEPPQAAGSVATPSPTPATPPSLDPKSLLTEAKVKGFIDYTRAITPYAGEAMGMATEALRRNKGDRAAMKRELLADQRTHMLSKVGAVALKKAGLTQAEATGLSRILARHYAKRMMVPNATAELAKVKGKKGSEPLEKMYQQQLADAEVSRTEFGKTYGKDALALADKFEKDYLEVQQAMLKAAFKRAPRKTGNN
jgi:hypothetical protein